MFSKYFAKAQRPIVFSFLLGAVFFLSYCSSNNKVASSFSKRKYTQGHFSDPVARLKTEPVPAGNTVLASALGQTQKPEITKPDEAKPAGTDAKKSYQAAYYLTLSKGTKTINNQISTGSNNASLKEAEHANPDHPYGGEHADYDHHDSKASSYLVAWLICLGISILCYAILLGGAFALFSGSEAGAGCVLILIGGFTSIAAIVLFILWIVALART